MSVFRQKHTKYRVEVDVKLYFIIDVFHLFSYLFIYLVSAWASG